MPPKPPTKSKPEPKDKGSVKSDLSGVKAPPRPAPPTKSGPKEDGSDTSQQSGKGKEDAKQPTPSPKPASLKKLGLKRLISPRAEDKSKTVGDQKKETENRPLSKDGLDNVKPESKSAEEVVEMQATPTQVTLTQSAPPRTKNKTTKSNPKQSPPTQSTKTQDTLLLGSSGAASFSF